MTLPSASKVKHHPAFGVSVSLHPDPPPLFRLADTSYLILIHAERRQAQEIAEEFVLHRTSSSRFQKWSASPHPVISVLEEGDYSYYRYDVLCGGREVLSMNAEVNRRIEGSVEVWAQDDQIVRRILGSAKCRAVP